MSISRLRKSRGYSIGAAVILAALLILAAVAIQSTVPSVTSPASMGAAAADASTPSSSGGIGSDAVATEQADAKKALAQKCAAAIKACQDKQPSCTATLDEKSDPKTGDVNDSCVGAVPDPSSAAKFRCVGRSAKVTYITSSASAGATDIQSVPDGNVAPGICKALICKPDAGVSNSVSVTHLTCSAATTVGISQADVTSALSGSGTFGMSRIIGQSQFTPSSPLDSNSQSILNSVYGKDPSDTSGSVPYDANGVIAAPSANQIAALSNSNPDTVAQQQSQDVTALTCQNNPSLCGNNSTLTPGSGSTGYQGPCPNGSSVSADGTCSSANQPQGPCPDGSAVDASGNCSSTNKPGTTFTPPPATPPSSPTPPPTNTSGSNSGNPLGNLFGNNNTAANNTPQSPFGGACNTRYVCQGNTLYYQSVGVQYGIAGSSCVTQPMQQCPYGCMAVTGANTSQSSLSSIGTDLQAFASILKVFGGGSSNSSVVNPNLSSQCAMTPQQAQGYQSPYGTGTNGQPCYQPPQQPDPSQCTSGTWQPTSAQQNGCVTGWQCVPNGSGTTSGTPTTPSAQLSCQPQIADVGTPISFSFSCGNATASKGTGFDTGGALSGNASIPAPVPPAGTNQATFSLTCQNQGVTAGAQCQVQLNKPGIVLVTNPRTTTVGGSSLIGWITAGMQSCAISSPDDQDFTARNAANTSTNGAATTSPLISGTTRFQLDCQTLAGGSKSATTTVTAN
jgi:hypothetical protein